MSHTVVGHPFLESKNHVTKGVEKDMKLGDGGRFSALTHELSGKPGIYNPAGLAAEIGRKRYGNKKMASMSDAGRGK
jgi:hypothetical protein